MREQTHLAETDRRYIKFKMKRIKEQKLLGNDSAARRHARELVQYIGVENDETPIEEQLSLTEDALPTSDSSRLRALRREVPPGWWRDE
jgi:hypothetical protein